MNGTCWCCWARCASWRWTPGYRSCGCGLAVRCRLASAVSQCLTLHSPGRAFPPTSVGRMAGPAMHQTPGVVGLAYPRQQASPCQRDRFISSEKSERDACAGSRLRPVNPEQDHRHAITGRDLDRRNRTVILWRETDLVQGSVERHVVVTLDATSRTAVILTLPQAVELADALRAAAVVR